MPERIVNIESLPERPEWQARASCRNLDPSVFFPEGRKFVVEEAEALAKSICKLCVVQEKCLQYALTNRITNGVWGGTTEGERFRLLLSSKS